VNQNRAVGPTVVALAVAGAAYGAFWVVLPSLEAASRQVDREAGIHIERARRLLHQYNAGLDYQALLVGSLRDLGVDAEAPENLSEDAADIYKDSHTSLWTSFSPTDSIDSTRPATTNYRDIDDQIRRGVAGREQLIRDNEDLLTLAAKEIDVGLSLSSGGADARSHAEANRLKGVIQYYEGLALRLQSALVRNEAQAVRRDLAEFAGRVESLKQSQTVLDDSGIDALLATIREEYTRKEQDVRRREREMAALGDKIAELERRIEAAKERRNKARRTFDQLREMGIDFSDPNGAADFAARIAEQDRVYREAVREMESLVAGSYPYAQIDATGDYLHGRYLENGSPANLTVEPGLKHYQAERAVAETELERTRFALDGARDDVAAFERLREDLMQQQRDAQDRIASLRPQATEIFDELASLEDEAASLEEQAIAKLSASAKTSKTAASLVGAWVDDARNRTQSLSPEKLEQSAFTSRTKAAWMGGHIAAQSADAELVLAWIHYDRFLGASRDAELFASLPAELGLRDADARAELDAAAEARDAGVKAIGEVHSILQRAHREADRQWTFVAQDAGAKYLLALFGDEAYAADAIEAYREALKGREDEPYVQRLAARLKRLEARQP